jgi:2-polyprenyl-3-methyl-5-hydroxy-6-metoxy-1,4-benzoquinol methylase
MSHADAVRAQGDAHGASPPVRIELPPSSAPQTTPFPIAMRAALDRYADQPRFHRWFTWGRSLLCPFREILQEVPPAGRVLDVGCGHGLFPNLLAAYSKALEITGCDPSQEKIDAARRSAGDDARVKHLCGPVQAIEPSDTPEGSYDIISIMDVLYLLPDELAVDILRHCRKLLAPGGVLLLKTNNKRPLWKYWVVYMEETLMVKWLAFTFGGQLHFRSERQYKTLLAECGFEVEKLCRIDGWRPVPHRLYVCRGK